MEQQRIDEIRAREQAATPGPWRVLWDSRPDIKTAYSIRAPAGGFMDEGQVVRAIKRYCSAHDGALGIAGLAKYLEKQSDDAEFIACARQDVPDLLDALEEKMAESERLRDIFKKAEWSEIFDVAGDPFIGCRWCHGAKPDHYDGCPFKALEEKGTEHELET